MVSNSLASLIKPTQSSDDPNQFLAYLYINDMGIIVDAVPLDLPRGPTTTTSHRGNNGRPGPNASVHDRNWIMLQTYHQFRPLAKEGCFQK